MTFQTLTSSTLPLNNPLPAKYAPIENLAVVSLIEAILFCESCTVPFPREVPLTKNSNVVADACVASMVSAR